MNSCKNEMKNPRSGVVSQANIKNDGEGGDYSHLHQIILAPLLTAKPSMLQPARRVSISDE